MNLSQQLKNLADKVVYAETTLSEYYNIGCIKVRLSDHMSSDMDCDLAVFGAKDDQRHCTYCVIPMVGTFKEVQWFKNTGAVIEFITRFESIARLLIKNPKHNNNQKERAEFNAANKAVLDPNNSNITPVCKDQIKFDTWMTKLATLYAEKNGSLRNMLNEIYRFSGNDETMKYIISNIANKNHDKKVASLDALIIRIKQNS